MSQLQANWDWCAHRKEVEVMSTALTPAAALTEVARQSNVLEGYQGSWRRAKISKCPAKSKKDYFQVIVRLYAAETMYALDDDGNLKMGELDTPVDDGYEGQEEMLFKVDVRSLRPWHSIADELQWPVPNVNDLSIGDRILYVDPREVNVRWPGSVRQKFLGTADERVELLLLYVEGPAGHQPDFLVAGHGLRSRTQLWRADEHNVFVSTSKGYQNLNDGADGGDILQTPYILPMQEHMRRDRDFVVNVKGAYWASEMPKRQYWGPCWVLERLSGNLREKKRSRCSRLARPDAEDVRAKQIRNQVEQSATIEQAKLVLARHQAWDDFHCAEDIQLQDFFTAMITGRDLKGFDPFTDAAGQRLYGCQASKRASHAYSTFIKTPYKEKVVRTMMQDYVAEYHAEDHFESFWNPDAGE